MKRPLTDDEFIRFSKVVKCNWLKCAGGLGLAGNGCCSFRGDYDNEYCSKFITDSDYDKLIKERA
jgi:hypothetical protein